ncbi:hypothetical protein [Salinadaptatus halalkaliphilus]|nr:hypothetical protein [Salinadaptatus halalkaliphilus]
MGEDFSRVLDPEQDDLDHGDLHPYVCESCRDRMTDGPHWDEERFARPEEKLVTVADGGKSRTLQTGSERESGTEGEPET